MQTVYTTYTTVVTEEKKTNWKIRKPRTSYQLHVQDADNQSENV